MVLPRNTNQDEEDSLVQQGGRPETVCRGEPAGRLEEKDGEEGCKETSPDGTRQHHSNTVAEALVSEQDSSAQEGEVTCSSHVKHQNPPTDFH